MTFSALHTDFFRM